MVREVRARQGWTRVLEEDDGTLTLVGDPSPELAADLDCLTNDILNAGNIDCTGLQSSGPIYLPSYTVIGVPDATLAAGQIIYVSNETGGATLAFSDGTNWRRVQDRSIVS
jgi:hypothetical protein